MSYHIVYWTVWFFFYANLLSIITQGQTALHKTCISGFTDVALLLIDKGVDINSTDIYVSFKL